MRLLVWIAKGLLLAAVASWYGLKSEWNELNTAEQVREVTSWAFTILLAIYVWQVTFP